MALVIAHCLCSIGLPPNLDATTGPGLTRPPNRWMQVLVGLAITS